MIRLPVFRSLRQVRLATLAFIAFGGCTDSAIVEPRIDGVMAARAGTQDPTVKYTDPDTATIDSTLNVRVFGSGFDVGSRADWAFKGVVSEKIKTNSTVFVSSTELLANITIAANANIGSHDVIVTTKTGKPGIGTELFVVTMKMTLLPTLGGSGGDAHAVNDAGHIVGAGLDSARRTYAVRWTNEGGVWTVRKMGPEPIPYQGSGALGINEQGTAVGESGGLATVWKIDDSKVTLGLGKAYSINNFDVIVGRTDTPVAWTPSGSGWTVRVLGLLAGVARGSCLHGEALDISDDNVIVGYVNDGACIPIAVMWRPTADGSGWLPPERLSPIGTMAQSVAQAIVGSTVVGTGYPCASLSGCKRKAFRWPLGGTSGALGTLDARANGLNRAGDIVGSYVVKSGRMTGFIWSPTTSAFVFLPSVNGVSDSWAWDINDAWPRLAVGSMISNAGGGGGGAPVVWTVP